MYQSPDLLVWRGRHDPLDGTAGYRLHHIIQSLDLFGILPPAPEDRISFALLGFACDEGVRRNLGRVGAREGPGALRKQLRNIALHLDTDRVSVFDAGDVICPAEGMESAQEMLGKKVLQLLQSGYRPIVLGGGHEIAFGHFLGINAHLPDKTIGIVNIDAHFDLRRFDRQGNSGTPFLQIYQKLLQEGRQFQYLVLGINELANTRALFETAKEVNAQWHLNTDFRTDNLDHIYQHVDAFAASVDGLYITVDLDAIDQSSAPGVSAPTPFGLSPTITRELLHRLVGSGKVVSIDVAELNPSHDVELMTSRLAAVLIHNIFVSWQ